LNPTGESTNQRSFVVLNRLKLAHKMFLLPVLAGVAVLVIFVAVQTSAARTARLVGQIDDGYIPKIDLSRDLVETLAKIQRGLQDAAAAADPQILDETDLLREAFVERLEEERNNPIIEASDIERLQTSFNRYYELARGTTLRLINQETGDSVFAAIEQMSADYNDIKKSLDAFAESARVEADQAVIDVKFSQERARNLVILVMLISAVVLGALSLTVTRAIVKPLAEVVRVADQVANGDLTERLEVETTDEVGQTGRALNQAFGQMGSAIKTIAENSRSLKGASEELTAVSHQMAASAEETSAQAMVVSASAEQVSHNVETVATGIEEMTASIREISDNAHDAARVATEAVEEAESTAATITRLDESSARISDVTKVITSISEQTNLLALNATIEAARAGESGKGFAVVANEVKELARETASATEEIGSRVEEIQNDTGSAVTAIGRIGTIVKRIHEIQNTIASAVEEQTATTNDIIRSVTEVAGGSSEIANSISGVATGTKDTAAGASTAQSAAQELAEMATVLKKLVEKFRYDESEA
jgi:methyl-accepting chemotaxis protein